jgi:predicted metal-dependent hydrolase
MGQFNETHLEILKQGVCLFNAQKYWECHEELEHYWLEESGPIRNVYWAIIQVAASMIHRRDGNLIGAKGLIEKAKIKFDRCEQFKLESDLLEKNLSWSDLKTLVRTVPVEAELSDFNKLFEFRFKDPEKWK